MAIQRLTGFEAEADVHGRLRRVSFNADTGVLLIEVADVAEATAIIDRLGEATVKTAKVGSITVAQGMSKADKAVLKDSPIEAASTDLDAENESQGIMVPKSKRRTRSTASIEKSSAAKTIVEANADEPKGSPSPGEVEAAIEADEHTILDDMGSATDPSQQGEDWVSDGREETELAKVEAQKKAAIKASEGVELPEELLKAKKLREVVGILFEDMGITDPDAILAKCDEIQSKVPVLKRIKGKLRDRVSRTMVTLEITD